MEVISIETTGLKQTAELCGLDIDNPTPEALKKFREQYLLFSQRVVGGRFTVLREGPLPQEKWGLVVAVSEEMIINDRKDLLEARLRQVTAYLKSQHPQEERIVVELGKINPDNAGDVIAAVRIRGVA